MNIATQVHLVAIRGYGRLLCHHTDFAGLVIKLDQAGRFQFGELAIGIVLEFAGGQAIVRPACRAVSMNSASGLPIRSA